MDEFYDQVKAGIRLEQMISNRGSAQDCTETELYLATAKIDLYNVRPFTQPRAWRLCSGGPNEPLEEACFRIQGILCGMDLPPVVLSGAKGNRLRARKYIRQNAKLAGFGNDDMFQCIRQIEAVYLKMLNQFKEGELEPWQPSTFEGNPAIEANTRYFTLASHATAADIVEFAPGVDPKGELRSMMQGEFVHTVDNKVDYMEQITTVEGVKTYRTVDPVVFKQGDLVEATVSFSVMQTKSKTAKMHMHLRALVLVDHSERDTAAILRMRQRYQSIELGTTSAIQTMLKRKTLYYGTDTDTEEANRRLHRMRIDGAQSD